MTKTKYSYSELQEKLLSYNDLVIINYLDGEFEEVLSPYSMAIKEFFDTWKDDKKELATIIKDNIDLIDDKTKRLLYIHDANIYYNYSEEYGYPISEFSYIKQFEDFLTKHNDDYELFEKLIGVSGEVIKYGSSRIRNDIDLNIKALFNIECVLYYGKLDVINEELFDNKDFIIRLRDELNFSSISNYDLTDLMKKISNHNMMQIFDNIETFEKCPYELYKYTNCWKTNKELIMKYSLFDGIAAHMFLDKDIMLKALSKNKKYKSMIPLQLYDDEDIKKFLDDDKKRKNVVEGQLSLFD